MESKNACWVAIWSGETLEHKETGNTAKLNHDNIPILIREDKSKVVLVITSFSSTYKDWEIQVKKDWREELNGKRTLCKVWNRTEGNFIREVIGYDKNTAYAFNVEGTGWKYCRQLTKSEIQELKDNAPEFADEEDEL